MFTGLVEGRGSIQRIEHRGAGVCLNIQGNRDMVSQLVLGESVSVDGACLTVVHFADDHFSVEATAETLACTTLGGAEPGQAVHLERALALGGRLGGHLVTGHVDGVGVVSSVTRQGEALIMDFDAPQRVHKYLVRKGSFAIDGVSRTVNGVTASGFDVVFIPHTQSIVHLHTKAVGARVNLESDIIGKYVERLMGLQSPKSKDQTHLDLLQRAGFVH